MLPSGNYPFTVRVFNVFHPGLDINLKIVRYHHRNYWYDPQGEENYTEDKSCSIQFKSEEGELRRFDVEVLPAQEDDAATYNLDGGMSLAFPMYFGDDYIEISLLPGKGKPSSPYYLSAGVKSKCIPGNGLGNPLPDTSLGEEVDKDGGTYFRGGTWKIEPNQENWVLTIKKYSMDPITDDVTVGPDDPE